MLLRSLPSRERGLKSTVSVSVSRVRLSLPSRERGLKSFNSNDYVVTDLVAPFAGAWIEIDKRGCEKWNTKVAPFAGAWIEISKLFKIYSPL